MLPLIETALPPGALEQLGQPVSDAAGQAVTQLVGSPTALAIGIGLIIATVLVFFLIKKIIINSILGVIAWAAVKFVLGVELPLLPSLAVSIIFGPAGVGVLLLLRFFGLV